jgi:two-component system chemotaxis sensor kinase CheA
MDAEEKDVFCQEAEELIGRLDANLLAIEQKRNTPEIVQDLFRAAHTLKGSSAAIGHHAMAELTHAMENVLEDLRQSRLTVTPELIDALLRAVDVLRYFKEEIETGVPAHVETADLIRRLQGFVEGPTGASSLTPFASVAGRGLESGPTNGTGARPEKLLRISARIAGDSLVPAARALQILLALDEVGKVVWSQPEREAIERGQPLRELAVLVESELSAGQMPAHFKHISEIDSLDVKPATELAGEAEEAPGESQEAESEVAKSVRGAAERVNNGSAKTVRTSVERLDKLMTLVGELVTDRNRLLQAQALLSTRYKDGELVGELAEGISHLASITDELQEEVMRARMLPLEHAFSKFPRLVRDLARDAGKSIALNVEGQETELDRSVIEMIPDPLLHLLRNAVDHGIESPQERVAAGKPAEGTIRLSGRSEGNHIIIAVSDDGHGIDIEKVRKAAVAHNLVAADVASHLTDAEVQELIFAPGLSTASKISDISGRGVGMDVVRNNVERLHGSVTVKSQLGRGTTFELSLPLTLAIMPVLLVGLSDWTYCIPLTAVTEVLAIDAQTIHGVDRSEVILWRDRLLPILRLDEFFGLPGGKTEGTGTLPTVAVHWGEGYLGLVVDRLVGQQEIVIKNLGHLIGQVGGLSGCAFLGDGSVALIVDVPGLIKRATRLGSELNVHALQPA